MLPEAAATSRLFLAIDAPEPVGRALTALVTPVSGVTWTPPERLHLTLRFLGDTPAERLPALREQLRSIRVSSFLLPVEGLGVFPPRGQPRVLWCGVGRGHPHLHQLRQRVDDTILALGLEADLKNFIPHFTLARLGMAQPSAIAQLLHRLRDFEGPPFRVERFSLYASELQPTGAVHRRIAEYPLSTP